MSREGWKCFRMKDESVYYGEIAFLTPEDEVCSAEELAEEHRSSSKTIRHGFGVQLFQTQDNAVHCKYEGHWFKDKKEGRGLCEYPNGDVYDGDFVGDRKEGQGRFTWMDGKEYIGEWKKDRMEGNGIFTHPSGLKHEGEFRGNYFLYGEFIINPFYSEEQLEVDLQQQNKYKKLYNRLLEAKKKEVKLHRLEKLLDLQQLLDKMQEGGRIPLLVASTQSSLRKTDVFESIKETCGGLVEIDMRHLDLIKRNAGKEELRRALRGLLIEALTKGIALVINLDDSSSKYEELYFPDITDFFSTNAFPSYILTPAVFKKNESIWKSFADGEDIEMNPAFKVFLWSKMKISGELDDQDALAKFIKCFGRAISLENIDCVICSNQVQEEEEEPVSPGIQSPTNT